MSTQSIGTSGANGAPVNFSGLGSGLNTSSIISALMAVERAPVNRLTHEQEVLQAEQQQLQGFQSSSRSRPPNSRCRRCMKPPRR